VTNIGLDDDEALVDFVTIVDGLRISPFRYGLAERRGKWSISYEYDNIADITLKSKLDVSSPPWLNPISLEWIPMPIHKQYGTPPLPRLQTVRLEENIAEKIARLNRLTPARDMYDLAWVATTANVWSKLDKDLIRRLAVLKIWTDANGVRVGGTVWKSANETYSFDPVHWLRDRSKGYFDTEDIGALAVPTPSVKELSSTISSHYVFLKNLDDDERILADIREKDRAIALKLLTELPDHRLSGIGLY
jgi:hypothetical protein